MIGLQILGIIIGFIFIGSWIILIITFIQYMIMITKGVNEMEENNLRLENDVTDGYIHCDENEGDK